VSKDWQEISYYLKDLPMTDEAMAESNGKIEEAMYRLGLIYAEELRDNNKAGETFDELLKRFPNTEKEAELWYRMYRGYLNDLEYSTSDYYKGLLLDKYPKSEYALMITNPESLEKLNELNIAGEKFYRKTYSLYQRGYYQAVISDCDKGLKTYEDTPIEPKIALLRAIAHGPEFGETRTIKELQNVAEVYKGTEEATKAEELITLLNQRQAEVAAQKKKEELLKNSPFKYKPDEAQYLIVMIDKEEKIKDPKVSVSDFNRTSYRSEGLKTTKVGFNEKYDMLSVQKFDNATKAMEYYNNFVLNTKFLGALNSSKAIVMVVSKEDYSVFYQMKSVEAYEAFFKEHYLK
jgi:tetratricopeptide (TPR) repeat protein